MQVLGIDLGSRTTGYCLMDKDGIIESGIIDFNIGKIEEKIDYIRNEFGKLIRRLDPSKIIYEAIVPSMNMQMVKPMIVTEIMFRRACLDVGISLEELVVISNKDWKKQILGNGNVKKEETMAWVNANMGTKLNPKKKENEDEADAICIALSYFGKRR